ncbi:hypothetical protein LDENG_00259190 [Lucifuga dentata]|nr:hypothetical protein LDENG_00259190 [Lucifuga dentata]
MFESNIFSFHTCYVTDNHFPKNKTVFQFSYFAKTCFLSSLNAKNYITSKKNLNTRLVGDDGLPIPRTFTVSTS